MAIELNVFVGEALTPDGGSVAGYDAAVDASAEAKAVQVASVTALFDFSSYGQHLSFGTLRGNYSTILLTQQPTGGFDLYHGGHKTGQLHLVGSSGSVEVKSCVSHDVSPVE